LLTRGKWARKVGSRLFVSAILLLSSSQRQQLSINRRWILSTIAKDAHSFGEHRRASLAHASPSKGKISSRESRASRYKESQRTNVKLVIHVEFLVILQDIEMRASLSLKSASLASQARRGKARFSRRWSKTGLVFRRLKGRKGWGVEGKETMVFARNTCFAAAIIRTRYLYYRISRACRITRETHCSFGEGERGT